MSNGAAHTRPLDGVRVLDFSHGVAGPYASMVLGDLGATIWKIERPARGDATRYMNVSERFVSDIPDSGGDYFLAINRNKLSVGLNLKHDSGCELALQLAAKADVVVSNFRPGVMDRLGLGYNDVRQLNAGIVYATISAYGDVGPLAGQPGMDVAVQARSGVMTITGYGDGPPVKPGASIADLSGGGQLATGVLAALYRREQTGEGGTVSVSLIDAMMMMLVNYSVATMDGGVEVAPMGSGHPQLVPFQAFKTVDGYVVIATGTNKLFTRLCEVLGCPRLAEDPRFETNPQRVIHREELIPLLEGMTATRSTREWLALLESGQVPCAPVNSLKEAFEDDQLAAEGMIVEVVHPTYGPLHVLASPYKFGGTRAGVRSAPPLLGEHTWSVLMAELELEERELRELERDGVISGYR
ncbi:MAG: CaiB/BaiF CoA transferase family protein [Candidatus Dormibacteria bacterium]